MNRWSLADGVLNRPCDVIVPHDVIDRLRRKSRPLDHVSIYEITRPDELCRWFSKGGVTPCDEMQRDSTFKSSFRANPNTYEHLRTESIERCMSDAVN